ncbi:MAG: DNA phosphorothioation system sulfurtransferase DndC [Planctomycetia bacterium]|nr:DNA phosphorothioation system sulfurtransferase DndC [Planctomycetia bacterium]
MANKSPVLTTDSSGAVPADRKVQASNKDSAFAALGLAKTVQAVCDEIRELYQWDEIPWVIGYSGGKDSSAVLQLIWLALRDLPAEKRTKRIHVISTDTLVEQPVVAAWVTASHKKMEAAAAEQGMPITPHKLTPDVKDTFWVNLIGKGYPAPRKLFRWCTSRMKINPSNAFIRSVVRDCGEAILVLGTRKAESQRRAVGMAKLEKNRVRERLTPNKNLPNSLVYTPIEDWTNDDVWLFLMQVKNPWGHTNKSLLGMYQGASADGECPLVVDTTTPSCGNSRFGCWVCTVVDKDRSMEAMIKNDDEKVWMTPLLDIRNDLGDFAKEPERRDYRRMSGRVQLFHDGLVRGPYTKEFREHWLRRVLSAQCEARRLGPAEFGDLELISMPELHEIRRIWLYEKHEFDDRLPAVYEEVVGTPFPVAASDDRLLRSEDWAMLQEACGGDEELFQLQAGLLDIEREYRGMSRRAGIYEALEDRLRAGQYGGEEEALAIRQEQERRREEIEKDVESLTLSQGSLFEEGEAEGG